MNLPDSREQEIREWVVRNPGDSWVEWLLAERDAALARVRQTEQERDELLRSEELAVWVESEAELHEVRARVAELERTKTERERDEARGASYYQQMVDSEADRSGLAMRCAELEKALTEIATHGCRHDLNPTRIIVRGSDDWLESERWWRNRAQSMDDAVRRYAREALAAGRPVDGEPDARIVAERPERDGADWETCNE